MNATNTTNYVQNSLPGIAQAEMKRGKVDKHCPVQSFEQAVIELNKIKNINSGGCGVAALALFRYIKSNSELSSRCVDIHFLALWEWQHVWSPIPTHIVLFVDGRVYDSEGDETDYVSHIYDHLGRVDNLDEDDLLSLLNDDRDSWNPTFSRKNVRIIERRLGVDLCDVDQ